MDIKTLLNNLHDEVSCSVCMCTFTDPKQLPCLHSFCLNCLNGIQRTSGVHGKITCPECRRQFQIHGSGNPSELPTNFRINSLLDVLAIKGCSTANVKCGNCDKQSAQTSYCFQCCSFWCEECILGHNIIRTNKEHKTLALKDFQDQDLEAVLQRLAFCQKKHHEKEELKFFCKSCKVAICNTCAVTLHEGHGKMPLQEATDERKAQINSMITSLKDKIVEKRKEVEQFNQKSMEVQAQVAAVKSQVQTNADQMIAIIEAREKDVFDEVDNQAKKSLETLSQKKDKVESLVKTIESAIEQTESLMKRNFSTEILRFNETFDTILQEQGTQENRDTECIPRFSFTKNEAVMNALNSEGIGNVKTVFSETKSQQSAGIAGNKEAKVPDSRFEAHLQTKRYIPVLSFGQEAMTTADEDWAAEVDEQERQISAEVDKLKLSNTSTTKPTEEKQADTEEEDNELTKATDLADASFLMKVLRSKLVQTKNEVEVQRNDPSSPLHSVKSFEELPLSEQLRRGVYDMGFNKPSKIQETALPMLLADPPNNMIAQSLYGTEITAAFVLSMLSRVDATKNFPQVICISPTYELALQTGQVAEKMGKFCPEVKIGYAVRGERVSRGQKVTDHIIFATPGTLLGWILRNRALDPKKIKMFVLLQADVIMACQGHQDQSIRIHKTLPKDCQMLLFSATYDDDVIKFAKTVVPDPIIIRLRREEESLDNIKQYYVVCCDKEEKFQALSNMYGVVSIGQCIVFCHTRKAASWLAEKMTADGHSVALLSGEITVEQRLAVLNRFREGKEKLLITTNVSARGIDVEQVTVVINYDMPVEPTGKPDYETYLHRIGRTGRFGKSGIAVNFVDGQRSMAIMKKIEEHFGKKITLLQADDVDELEKLGN